MKTNKPSEIAETGPAPAIAGGLYRLSRFLGFCLLVIIILAVAAVFSLKLYVVTPAFKKQVIKQVESLLGVQVELKKLKLKIFQGVSLTGLAIKDKTGSDAVLVDELILKYDVFALFRKKLRLTRITVNHPRVNLRETSPGNWNLARLMPASGGKKPAGKKRPGFMSVSLDEITVNEIEIKVEKNGRLTLKGIDLIISDFTSSNPTNIQAGLSTTKKQSGFFQYLPADHKTPDIEIPGFTLTSEIYGSKTGKTLTGGMSLAVVSLKIEGYPSLKGNLEWQAKVNPVRKQIDIKKLAVSLGEFLDLKLSGKMSFPDSQPQCDLRIKEMNADLSALLAKFGEVIREKWSQIILPSVTKGKVNLADFQLALGLTPDYKIKTLRPSGQVELSLASLAYPPYQLELEGFHSRLEFKAADASTTLVNLRSSVERIEAQGREAKDFNLTVRTELEDLKIPREVAADIQITNILDGSLEVAAVYNPEEDELNANLTGRGFSLSLLSRKQLSGELSLAGQLKIKRKQFLSQDLKIAVKNLTAKAFNEQMQKQSRGALLNFAKNRSSMDREKTPHSSPPPTHPSRETASAKTLISLRQKNVMYPKMPPQDLNLHLLGTVDLTKQTADLKKIDLTLGNWLELNSQLRLNGRKPGKIYLDSLRAKIIGEKLSDYLRILFPQGTRLGGEYILTANGWAENLPASGDLRLDAELRCEKASLTFKDKPVTISGLENRSIIKLLGGQVDINSKMTVRKTEYERNRVDNLELAGRFRKKDKRLFFYLNTLKAEIQSGVIAGSGEFSGEKLKDLYAVGKVNLKNIDLAAFKTQQLKGKLDAGLTFEGDWNQLTFKLENRIKGFSKCFLEKRTTPLTVKTGLGGVVDLINGGAEIRRLQVDALPILSFSGNFTAEQWGKKIPLVSFSSNIELAAALDWSKGFIPRLENWELGGKARISGGGRLTNFKEWQGETNLLLEHGKVINNPLALAIRGVNLDALLTRPPDMKTSVTVQANADSASFQEWSVPEIALFAKISSSDPPMNKLKGDLSLSASEVASLKRGVAVGQPGFTFSGEANRKTSSISGAGEISLAKAATAKYQLEIAEKGQRVEAVLQADSLELAELFRLMPKAKLSGSQGNLSLKASYRKKPDQKNPRQAREVVSAAIKIKDAGLTLADKTKLNSLNGSLKMALMNFRKGRVKGVFGWQDLTVYVGSLNNGKLVFQSDIDDLKHKVFQTKVKQLSFDVNLNKPRFTLKNCALNGEVKLDPAARQVRFRDWRVALGKSLSFELDADLDDFGDQLVSVAIKRGKVDYQALRSLLPTGDSPKLQITGEGALEADFTGSIPELARGRIKGRVRHTFEQVTVSFKNMAEVGNLTGFVQLDLRGLENSVNGKVTASGIRIKGNEVFSGAATQADFLISSADFQTIKLTRFNLGTPDKELEFQATGKFDLAKDNGDLATLLVFRTDQFQELYPGVMARGELKAPLSVIKEPRKNWRLAGEIIANAVSVKYQDKLSVRNITGTVPVSQAGFSLEKTASEPVALTSGYELFRTYFLNKEPMSNFKIDQFRFRQAELNNLDLDVKWENDQFRVGRFKGTFWDGDLAGSLGADFTGGLLRYHVKANLTNIDLKHAFGQEAEGGKSYLTTANLNIRGQGAEDIEGDINVTGIDKKLVDRLLIFIDPGGKNPTVNSTREKINKLGKVPKEIHLKARQATINLVLLLESTKVGLVTSIIPEAVNISSIPIKLLKKKLISK